MEATGTISRYGLHTTKLVSVLQLVEEAIHEPKLRVQI
jgi:hypothetical protein